jgi:peptidoglycan/xylan/chitin deacetylase (PgdA/CDA1 family)
VEIGLHGYDHELWGPTQWYLPDRPINVTEKEGLLRKSIEAFETSSLSRPVSFRAPNLVADTSTIRLLLKWEFTADSSLASHRGTYPIPEFVNGGPDMIRIPVSAEPWPSISRIGRIWHYAYRVCNLKTLLGMNEDERRRYLKQVVAVQLALGFQPSLVMLFHSWEFLPPLTSASEYAYCSALNWDFLRALAHTLDDSLDIEFVTLRQLTSFLRDWNAKPKGID